MNQMHPLTKLINGGLLLVSNMRTWFNVGSVKNLAGYSDMHLRAISREESMLLFCIRPLNFMLVKLLPYLQGANVSR